MTYPLLYMKNKHFCRTILYLWHRWGLPDFSVQLSALVAITENSNTSWLDRVCHAEIFLCVWNVSHSVYGTLWKSLAGISLSSAKPIFKCLNLAGAGKDQGKEWDLPKTEVFLFFLFFNDLNSQANVLLCKYSDRVFVAFAWKLLETLHESDWWTTEKNYCILALLLC